MINLLCSLVIVFCFHIDLRRSSKLKMSTKKVILQSPFNLYEITELLARYAKDDEIPLGSN